MRMTLSKISSRRWSALRDAAMPGPDDMVVNEASAPRLAFAPDAPILRDARGRSLKSVELKELIPPFLSVRVFEAAARSGSFARAAEELGITPGAVSQHIRVL